MSASEKCFLLLAMACLSTQSWADSLDLGLVEGVYKSKVKVFGAQDEEFQGENILEVVKISETAAYIRVHVDGVNGGICSIHGIAGLIDDYLQYKSEEINGCSLRVNFSNENVTLNDDRIGCSQYYCGRRAGLDHLSFASKSKRKIKYMTLLKQSSEYKSAINEYESHK